MKPLLAFVFAALTATAASAQITLTDPADIALAVAVSDAVDGATESIGGCREGGGELADCLCAHRADVDQVRAALDAALTVHPEWRDQSLFAADMGNGQSLTIFLDTVARAAAEPDCG
ncbi:MAG TPA: hypothetical protein VLA52_08720 [Thermohalobaculum sp.]|nr:hypothetical protein [Thermohalobaculum sp.]